MTRVCTICSHPDRAAIEDAVVVGASYRDIAGQFSVSRTAVQRHVSEHIQGQIKQSQAAKEEAQAIDVIKQLKDINRITLAILKDARNEKKNGMALFAIDRIVKQLELQSKLLGNIDTPQVNIYVSPEWQTIRAALVQALMPFPDARIAAASVLAGLEATHAGLN